MRKTFSLLVLSFAIFSCTPAKIVKQNYDSNIKTTEVTIVRPDSIKFVFVPSIFGFDGMDVAELNNNQKIEIEIPTGDHEFFIRSDQADRPFKYSRNIKEDDKICFVIRANLKSWLKLFYFSNAFTIVEGDSKTCNNSDSLSQ